MALIQFAVGLWCCWLGVVHGMEPWTALPAIGVGVVNIAIALRETA